MPAQTKKNKYAPNKWGTELTIDLECPSGQLCLVRRPGISGLVRAGILDSLDALSGIVQTDHVDRVRKGNAEITPEDIAGLAKDKDRLLEAIELSDKAVEYVVVQPKVLRPVVRDDKGAPVLRWAGDLHEDGSQKMVEIPLPDTEREPGQVYTDMIDMMDKMYIFQFVVGGVSDLERFRAEFAETLGGVEALQNLSQSA